MRIKRYISTIVIAVAYLLTALYSCIPLHQHCCEQIAAILESEQSQNCCCCCCNSHDDSSESALLNQYLCDDFFNHSLSQHSCDDVARYYLNIEYFSSNSRGYYDRLFFAPALDFIVCSYSADFKILVVDSVVKHSAPPIFAIVTPFLQSYRSNAPPTQSLCV